MSAPVLNPCAWCGKHRRRASDWEQAGIGGEYKRLCVRCANRRLNNPYNSLLPMRKVAEVAE